MSEKQKAKAPLTERGLLDASADPLQIDAWTRSYPGCAWGARPPADTTILDIDRKRDVDGFATLAALEHAYGPLPPTRTSTTPSRGQHRIFHTAGHPVFKNRAGVRPGLDVRSNNGYIVVPPSEIETGRYEWADARADVAAAPAWLIEQLFAFNARHHAISSGVVPDGRRNDTLYRYACLLRARNVPEESAWGALLARNQDCEPPLDDEGELKQIFVNAWKHAPGFALTDLGNAERLVATHGSDWRYLPELGWCRWEGHRWVEDRENRIVVVAGDVARRVYAEAAQAPDDAARRALAHWAVKSESRRALEATAALARSRPEVVDHLDRYDAAPTLLAVRGGVIELETGHCRDGRRDDRLLRSADCEFDSEASAPRFERFLREIFNSDEELIRYLQRALGYAVSGLTEEQALFVLHGTGANGKSTLTNTVRRLLGDYALTVQPESLMTRDRAGIPNDIARLRGARFVVTQEVEDGRKLAESLVKQLTGGDTVSARFLHREFFEFQPSAKIFISTNHRPIITGTDWAIWRRIQLIPFGVTIAPEQRDGALDEKLNAESSGVLNWLIRGFREWRQHGLQPPEVVRSATQQYRQDIDRVGVFVHECCEKSPNARERKTHVYDAYRAWADKAGVGVLSKLRLHEKLTQDHGFKLGTRDGYACYVGVQLTDLEM